MSKVVLFDQSNIELALAEANDVPQLFNIAVFIKMEFAAAAVRTVVSREDIQSMIDKLQNFLDTH